MLFKQVKEKTPCNKFLQKLKNLYFNSQKTNLELKMSTFQMFVCQTKSWEIRQDIFQWILIRNVLRNQMTWQKYQMKNYVRKYSKQSDQK